jgi:hypothetical protein
VLEAKFKDKLKKSLQDSYDNLLYDKIVQGPLTGAGRPDTLVIGSKGDNPGTTVYIENKVKKNKPSAKQYFRMLEICRAGGSAIWNRLENDGKVHWYDPDNEEYLITELEDCEGVLEKSAEAINNKRDSNFWGKVNPLDKAKENDKDYTRHSRLGGNDKE